MAKITPKQPEKISADCPHCGFTQLESAYAKSTFCRKCGEHYSIEKLLLKETESLKGPSLMERVSKLVARDTSRNVSCFSCGHQQTVTTSAQSSLCPSCGSYIDLRDFTISGPFGRSIQTQGSVFIQPKGDVTSSRIACREAVLEGKLRGTLTCTGTVRVKAHGKILGAIETQNLVVEKRCDAEFVRPVKAFCVEVNGRISVRLHCETCVTVNKGGYLEGTIYAKSIVIEKGGVFSGELFIGQQELEQAELLGATPGLFPDEGFQPA